MPERLQILILEDDVLDAELLVRALKRAGFEFDWERVDSEDAYLEKLRPELDLIFSDFKMPQFGGLRALELLKESGLEIPFIIMSGTIGEENVVSVMKHGATDCMLKDRMTGIDKAVRNALEQRRTRKAPPAGEEELRTMFEKQRKQLDESRSREEALKAEVNELLARQNEPRRYPK